MKTIGGLPEPEKKNGTQRITLCFPVLLNAEEIILLVTGSNKIKLLEEKKQEKTFQLKL